VPPVDRSLAFAGVLVLGRVSMAMHCTIEWVLQTVRERDPTRELHISHNHNIQARVGRAPSLNLRRSRVTRPPSPLGQHYHQGDRGAVHAM